MKRLRWWSRHRQSQSPPPAPPDHLHQRPDRRGEDRRAEHREDRLVRGLHDRTRAYVDEPDRDTLAGRLVDDQDEEARHPPPLPLVHASCHGRLATRGGPLHLPDSGHMLGWCCTRCERRGRGGCSPPRGPSHCQARLRRRRTELPTRWQRARRCQPASSRLLWRATHLGQQVDQALSYSASPRGLSAVPARKLNISALGSPRPSSQPAVRRNRWGGRWRPRRTRPELRAQGRP